MANKLSLTTRFKKFSRTPRAVPFYTFSVMLLISGTGFVLHRVLDGNTGPVSKNQIVIISHDKEQQVVPSREQTVGSLLKKLAIPINKGDVVEPALSTPIDQDQFRINVYRALPVEIVDGNKRTFTVSAATTPRSIAKQAGANVFSEDIVANSPTENFIKNGSLGTQVVIDRSQPVNLNLYGTQVATRTRADTVGDLVKQKDIKLAKDDQLIPSADTPITANTQIFVVRNGIKIESVTEQIAMPTQNINDPNLAYGTSAVRQQGSAGEKVTTYQSQTQNGVVVGRTVLQEIVTKQPVTQIAVVGSSLSGIKGDMARAGIAPGDFQYADYIISKESGWRPNARNASGAYGLCQALPGSKMTSAGADWETNPVTQLKWCNGYAKGRYGSWAAAYSYWQSRHYW